jgi:hypothetical protein
MKGRANFNMCLLMSMFLLVMVGSAAGDIIFHDDFTGDSNDGRFVMEAENYSRRISGAGANFWEVSGSDNTFLEGPSEGQVAPTAKSGARGNYMEALGFHIGGVAPIDDFYDGPFLDYKVSVGTPGTYRLYVRWTGHDIASDSLYAFILKSDGALLSSSGLNYFNYHQYRKDWIWDNRGVKNKTKNAFAGFPHSAVWMISWPGDYTIRLAHRESGSAVDAIVFQTANLPAPSDSGPLQSLFVPETIRLSAREIITINNIRLAIAEKVKALERIDAALERDWAAYKALEEMLTGSEYGYLGYNGVAAVKQRIHSVIHNQEQSKEVLRNSIAKLEDVLAALGFQVELTPGR